MYSWATTSDSPYWINDATDSDIWPYSIRYEVYLSTPEGDRLLKSFDSIVKAKNYAQSHYDETIWPEGNEQAPVNAES